MVVIKRFKHISIISPGRRQGNTTLAISIGLMLSTTQNISVCLTHTGADNEALITYLGDKIVPDVTNSFEQVGELAMFGQLSQGSIVDYMHKLSEGYYFLDTTSKHLSTEVSSDLLLKVFEYLDFDVVITDISTEIYDEITQEVLRRSDLVLVVLEQAKDMLNKLLAWKESEYYSPIYEIEEMFVLNKFNRVVSSLKEFCKEAQIHFRRTEKCDYTAEIQRLSNRGNLLSLYDEICERDVDLLGFDEDMKRLIHKVCLSLGFKFIDWRNLK